LLEAPLEDRVRRVFEGYVRAPTERHGPEAVQTRLAADLLRLRRRLGAQRTDGVLAALTAAAADWHDAEAHAGWIGTLLTDYYDRLYGRAFEASGRSVAFRGEAAAVIAYLRTAA
jgi:tRNA 2-selenouridine synthase SelU